MRSVAIDWDYALRAYAATHAGGVESDGLGGNESQVVARAEKTVPLCCQRHKLRCIAWRDGGTRASCDLRCPSPNSCFSSSIPFDNPPVLGDLDQSLEGGICRRCRDPVFIGSSRFTQPLDQQHSYRIGLSFPAVAVSHRARYRLARNGIVTFGLYLHAVVDQSSGQRQSLANCLAKPVGAPADALLTIAEGVRFSSRLGGRGCLPGSPKTVMSFVRPIHIYNPSSVGPILRPRLYSIAHVVNQSARRHAARRGSGPSRCLAWSETELVRVLLPFPVVPHPRPVARV